MEAACRAVLTHSEDPSAAAEACSTLDALIAPHGPSISLGGADPHKDVQAAVEAAGGGPHSGAAGPWR